MPEEKYYENPRPQVAGQVSRQQKLPLRVVLEIAKNGLKIRFWRSMVTAAGIFLGIAFFSFVLTNQVAVTQMTSDERARQIWLIVMSLMVSTVGIANSMLMSVTERFREIGTMKCLGALDGFVVTLFFIEALFMGVVASFVGWLLGFMATMVVRWARYGWTGAWAGLDGAHVLFLIAICTGIGAALTLIATIAPAMRAAAMPAVAALRTEV
jgi:hypothetical protein